MRRLNRTEHGRFWLPLVALATNMQANGPEGTDRASVFIMCFVESAAAARFSRCAPSPPLVLTSEDVQVILGALDADFAAL